MGSQPTGAARLYQPAVAVRIDNDVFLGSPLPPEEPVAKNPPDGALIDYYVHGAAKAMALEISDSSGKLVRRFTSGVRKEQPHPPLAIAERWFPKPVLLENTAGAHRFLWDLRWGSSGVSAETEDDEGFGAPRGPRAVPGTYQLKLTVDGTTYTQPLKLTMDPRSQATSAELDEQLRLGLEVFDEVRSSRKALAEMAAVKKHLAQLPPDALRKHQQALADLTTLNAQMEKIEKGDKSQPGAITGLESAAAGLSAALRVVESSDRQIPSQAVTLYQEADRAAKAGIADWTQVKANQLAKLNEELQKAGVAPIQISEIQEELEYLMSL